MISTRVACRAGLSALSPSLCLSPSTIFLHLPPFRRFLRVVSVVRSGSCSISSLPSSPPSPSSPTSSSSLPASPSTSPSLSPSFSSSLSPVSVSESHRRVKTLFSSSNVSSHRPIQASKPNKTTEKKQLIRAEDLVKQIRDKQKQGHAIEDKVFTNAITAFGRCGEWEKAVHVLQLMEECGVRPDGIKYNACIQACQRSSQWGPALGLVYEMETKGLVEQDLKTYTLVLQVLTHNQRLESAVDTLRSLKAYGMVADAPCYTVVIEACEREGKYELAIELFDEMRKSGSLPDRRLAEVALVLYKKLKRWAKALELARYMALKLPLVDQRGAATYYMDFTTEPY